MRTRSARFILVVTFALGLTLLILIILPRYFNPIDTRMTLAKYKIKSLQESLDRFKEQFGEYPETEEGLHVLLENRDSQSQLFFARSIIDPWGVPYHYRSPGVHNKASYDLWTYGADNLPGGYKKNTDIKNW